MVIYQNQYINLYPLIQITFKILYTYNLHFRKRNIFQDLKVLVFCNNTLCICSNGTNLQTYCHLYLPQLKQKYNEDLCELHWV